jgi:hypothetical protein
MKVTITAIWRRYVEPVTGRMTTYYGRNGAVRPAPGERIAAGRYWGNYDAIPGIRSIEPVGKGPRMRWRFPSLARSLVRYVDRK